MTCQTIQGCAYCDYRLADIIEAEIFVPRELEELYEMYQHETQQLEEGVGSQRFLPAIKVGAVKTLYETSLIKKTS